MVRAVVEASQMLRARVAEHASVREFAAMLGVQRSRAQALTDGARVETITAAEVILLSDADDPHARAIGHGFARDLAIRCGGANELVAPRAQLALFSDDSMSAERTKGE